jgi:hypothetical protein
MKTYLLLRNNRQSGPYTLAELLVEGLRSQDLVWVEGQSASWRYPAELDELKAHVPPPVLDAALDLGFVEVQNRVVPQRSVREPVSTATLEPPVASVDTAPDPLRMPRILADLPSLPAASVMNEQSVPAFDALAGLLPDDDLMPTMAWQSVKETSSGDILPQKIEARSVSGTAFAGVPAAMGSSKVNVLLPAALPDKTMVVIRRRDQDGQPVSAPRVRTRRPVLEFLEEEAETAPETEGSTITVDTRQEALPHASTQVPLVLAVAETEQHALPVEMEPNPVQIESMVSATGDIADQIETAESRHQAGVTEMSTADMLPEPPVNFETVQETAAPTLQVNISMVQRIAVITAIISLIAVAILLANSIFNPNAYQYGTKPASSVSKQASPTDNSGTIKP